MWPVQPIPSRPAALDPHDVVAEWTSAARDRVVVHQARGTLWCDPLVGQLLDAVAPTSDPSGGLRPGRHYLLDIDDRDHIVLVASRVTTDGKTAPVALARCVRVPGTRIGVLSIVVRADLRGRGIGSRLLATLRGFAGAHGIERFRLGSSSRDPSPARSPCIDGPVSLAR